MKGLVYSPRERIPLFKLLDDAFGDRSAEYRNKRTGCTELVKVSNLVIYLLEAEMTADSRNHMIYSPKMKIPLGIMFRDSYGACFIEVKYKNHRECIRFSSYIALLLEAEARKAG